LLTSTADTLRQPGRGTGSSAAWPHPSRWRRWAARGAGRHEGPDLFPAEVSRKSPSDCSWTWTPCSSS